MVDTFLSSRWRLRFTSVDPGASSGRKGVNSAGGWIVTVAPAGGIVKCRLEIGKCKSKLLMSPGVAGAFILGYIGWRQPTRMEPNNYLTLKNIGGNGVIMRTKVLLITCLLVFVFGCNLFSSVNALTFDVGTKVSETDPDNNGYQYFYFDSGCMLYSHPDYLNDASLIFDGNTSTGINKNYGSGHSKMILAIIFPYPFHLFCS